jgi:hypothetical protein
MKNEYDVRIGDLPDHAHQRITESVTKMFEIARALPNVWALNAANLALLLLIRDIGRTKEQRMVILGRIYENGEKSINEWDDKE